jgi:pimeloyl-ACP methyl ester carboxylesterase
MNIVYIHGNAATTESFNFIRMQLTGYNDILLEYDSADGFYNNYKGMRERLDSVDDIFFIAHSLGGIYALHLANELSDIVLGAVTISTPYGGSKAAQFAQYLLPFNQVLHDIQPHSPPIANGHDFTISRSWTNIVTTGGHSSLMTAANDGVVTQDSMCYRQDITLIDVESNHPEVLQSHEAVGIIRKVINGLRRRTSCKAGADAGAGPLCQTTCRVSFLN